MIKRIGIYLQEMFPITAILGTVVSAIAVQMVYLRLYDLRPSFGIQLVLPGLVLTFISLLLRIMDEFKDYQDDLTNFPHRPLPSGRVKKEDLGALALVCVLMVIFLSSTSVSLLVWGIITLIFSGLMYKWFFIEEIMRKNLPLAFITHHPVVVFNFIYLVLACMQLDGRVGWDKWAYVLPIVLMYTNWELVRKIRAPEQETSYTTYSKIFGPRLSMSMSFALQAIYNTSIWFVFQALGTPLFVQMAYFAIQLALLWPSIRFMFNLKLKGPLRPNAEGQILVVVGFLLAAALL